MTISGEHFKVILGKRTIFCNCGQKGEYSEKYDSFYCAPGNIWLETECKCSDDCEFRPRPDNPDTPISAFFPIDRATDLPDHNDKTKYYKLLAEIDLNDGGTLAVWSDQTIMLPTTTYDLPGAIKLIDALQKAIETIRAHDNS